MNTFYFKENNGILSVLLNSTEAANAWEGRIILPPGGIRGIISEGGATDFWQSPPAVRDGEIHFAGGSARSTSGEVMLFRILPSAPGKFSFAETRLYAADGKGTELQSGSEPFTISETGSADFKDAVPPETFSFQKYRSPKVFNGQPVLIFSASDAGSGISRYEIKEYTRNGDSAWHEAQSPYLLNGDVLKLGVRAIDNAGNVREENIRIAQYIPAWIWLVLAIAAILGTLIVYNKRRS
jgi:hypothetical protein